MPRPKKPGAGEPKRRSRNGCWPCKARKVKCGEEKPGCVNCEKAGDACDYSIRLNWNGRGSKKAGFGVICFDEPSPTAGSATGPESLVSPVTPKTAETSPWTDSNLSPGPLSSSVASPYDTSRSPGEAPRSQPAQFLNSGLASHDARQPKREPDVARDDSSVPPSSGYPSPEFLSTDGHGERPSKRARLDAGPETLHSSTVTSDAKPRGKRRQMEQPAVSSTDTSPAQESPSLLDADGEDDEKPEFPRLSVNSLLSTPTSQDDKRSTIYYGVDHGLADLDLGKNDDADAISPTSPRALRRNAEAGGAEAEAVVIRIPRSLEPLPAKLLDNPMNLLYFHHFLTHTARVLVPHDDPLSNPFRTILPTMAVHNDHLLSLLLAYAAAHRARLLRHPEPRTRIALWVQDIFPALRRALSAPAGAGAISTANIAAAVMLASLEIISPTAFGAPAIPWHRHLALARALIAARPGGLRVGGGMHRGGGVDGTDEVQVCSFLWSWYAYLDVLGSLSPGAPREVSAEWILGYKVYDVRDDDEIDCIMGFTTRCAYILAGVAELARRCDALRAAAATAPPASTEEDEGGKEKQDDDNDSATNPPWTPPADILSRATTLESDLAASLAAPPRACAHIRGSGDEARWDAAEMGATNAAYHWGGRLVLLRRVRGAARGDAAVQRCVREVVRCLGRVRAGGTAEACLVFPMFAAGCEALPGGGGEEEGEGAREVILARVKGVEGCGMTQVGTARAVMEKVWASGRPWGELLGEEFIG